MFRIDSDTAVAALPAPAAPGAPGYFTNGTPGPGIPVPATNFNADWCNAIQEENMSILTAAGIAESKGQNDQILTAIKLLIQSGAGGYATDTGAANAYIITPAPPSAAYVGGQTFRMVPAHANTGASTVNVSGLGVKSIVHSDGSALLPGDIPAVGLVELIYHAGLGKFILNSVATPTYVANMNNGYMRIPGTPFILQWCNGSAPAGAGSSVDVPSGMNWWSYGAISWPISFPNATCWWQGYGEIVSNNYFTLFSGGKQASGLAALTIVRNTNIIGIVAQPFLLFAIGF